MAKNLREYKLIVVGGGGVGKSCLTVRFVEDKWRVWRGQFLLQLFNGRILNREPWRPLLLSNGNFEQYDPTIEDSYMKKCVVDNEEVLLSVLDTAGQDDYAAMREHYMRPGEGFLLVYSITDRASFEELEVFYEQILRVKDRDFFPMMICGTKCDLEFDRQVPSSDGRALAARLHGRHIETSAKNRINVDSAFIELVKLIKVFQREQYQTRLPGRTSVMPEQHPGLNESHGNIRGCGCIIA